jgi:hypothetical protein
MSRKRIEFKILAGEVKSEPIVIHSFIRGLILPKNLSEKVLNFFIREKDFEGVSKTYPLGFFNSSGVFEKSEITVPSNDAFKDEDNQDSNFISSILLYTDLKSSKGNSLIIKINESIAEDAIIYVVTDHTL